MGQSISAYLKGVGEVRSVRHIHVIASVISADPNATPNVRRESLALIRKLDQIIDLPIAKAAFLASIWRDFCSLNMLLEKDRGKLGIVSGNFVEKPDSQPKLSPFEYGKPDQKKTVASSV